jgi:hypothetical protein
VLHLLYAVLTSDVLQLILPVRCPHFRKLSELEIYLPHTLCTLALLPTRAANCRVRGVLVTYVHRGRPSH